MTRAAALAMLLAVVGCSKIDVDCRKGTAHVESGIDASPSTLMPHVALTLASCPKEREP